MPENHQNDDKARRYMTLIKGAMIGHYWIIEIINSGGKGEMHTVKVPI